MVFNEEDLMERDAKRNIGEELLQSIRDVKGGRLGATHEIELTEAAQARSKARPLANLPKR
jgi:putative transcriptional regulator